MEDVPVSWFNEEEDGSGIKAFMCLIDFECEAGAAAGGNRIFPSVEDCLKNRKCSKSCGVVEIRLKAVSVPVPSTEELPA